MTKGVLLYCFDTPHVSYSKITDRCISLIERNLNLPVTVVTDADTKLRIKSDCDTHVVDIEKGNTKFSKPWYNLERHLAFEHSPYDRTVVMDVDYFCYSDKILRLLESENDFLVHKNAHDVMHREIMRYDRQAMLDLVWATVLIFNKTPRTKAIFDTVKLVKQNYQHYCNLYRISYMNFRNDYAFAIALNQINGHRDYDLIPDSIATVPAVAEILELNDKGAVIRWDNKTILVQDQDLHFLNKEIAYV
jgi:hypothetical protein